MEDTSGVFSEMDSTMDKVVKLIYSSCDPDNTNCVRVSLLMSYVKPYMPNNSYELDNLQERLDPNHTDPGITGAFFYEAMNEWTSRIRENPDITGEAQVLDENEMPFHQSTPRTNLGYMNLVQSCSEILNISNATSYNNEGNNTISPDKATLVEEIKQLQHQIRRTTNELDLVKQQLASAEEQNEVLNGELNKLTRSLYSERHLNEQLSKNIAEVDDIKEEAAAALRRAAHLEKALMNAEKIRDNVLIEVKNLEIKVTLLEEKLEVVRKKEQEAKKEIIDINNEMDVKDAEMNSVMEMAAKLRGELEIKDDFLRYYENENELLRHKASTLEKTLRETYSAKTECFLSQIINETDGPNLNELIAGRDKSTYEDEEVFNSPKLLNQLANPISPKLDSPILYTSTTTRKSLDSDDSPVFGTGMKLLRQVLLRTTSTPNPVVNGGRNESLNSLENGSSNGYTNNYSNCSNRKSLQNELGEVSNQLQSPNQQLRLETNGLIFDASRKCCSINEEINSTKKSDKLEYSRETKHKSLQDELRDVSASLEEIVDNSPKTVHSQAKNQEYLINKLRNLVKEQSEKIECLKKSCKLELESCQQNCTKKEELITSLKEKFAICEHNLNQEKENNQQLKEKLVTEYQKYRVKLNELEELKHKYMQLEADVKELPAHNGDVLAEYNELRSQYSAIEKRYNITLDDKYALQKNLQHAENIAAMAKSTLTSISDRIMSLKMFADRPYDNDGDNLKNLPRLIDILVEQAESDKSIQTNNLQQFSDVCTCGLLKSRKQSGGTPTHKKTNYDKQQMKIEKLECKTNKLEKELNMERNINTNMALQLNDLKEENERLNREMQKIQMLQECHDNLTNSDRNMLEQLCNENSCLEEENNREILADEGVKELGQELEVYKSKIENLQQENACIIKDLQQFEMKARAEELNCVMLRKQIVDLYAVNVRCLDLEKLVKERNEEIESLRVQLQDDEYILNDFDSFVTAVARELGRISSDITILKCRFKSDLSPNIIHLFEELDDIKNRQYPTIITKNMFDLKCRIELVVELIKVIAEKCFVLQENVCVFENSDQNGDGDYVITNLSSNSNDSFTSCVSTTSLSSSFEADQELFFHEPDSFLNNLELGPSIENTSSLSRKDMEEKFTVLSLMLTIDLTTVKERHNKQKLRYFQLAKKHQNYLKSALRLLKNSMRVNREKIECVIMYLELMDGMNTEVLKSAEQWGILQYEIRTMKCWNLVVNYVAILSEDKNKNKANGDDSFLLCDRSLNKIHRTTFVGREGPGKKYSYFFVCVILVLILVGFLSFYVDWHCSTKHRNQICPLEWFSNFVFETTYAPHIL